VSHDVHVHPFDHAIALTPAGAGRYSAVPSPAYANFVGPFGGVTAARLLRAALLHDECLGEPVALTVNFAAPVADEPMEIVAAPARTNRSTQHWSLEMRQSGGVVSTGSAVFAARRQTWSSLELTPPAAPAASAIAPLAIPEGFPVWLANYEMRLVHGGMDLAADGEAADSVTTLWLRDNPPRPLDFPALAALSDAFFPRIFVRRQRLALIGTVTLTVYFHTGTTQLSAQGSEPLLCTARASNFRDGYFDQVAELWGSAGELLATTHQMVYFRE